MSKFYHRTNNIRDILRRGGLASLDRLALRNPNQEISIEPNRWDRTRETVSIQDAIKSVKDSGKYTDRVYFTKGSPMESSDYGKYIIEKDITTPMESEVINMIPEEYYLRRPVSLKRTATVYVPKSEMEELAKLNNKIKIKPLSDYVGDYHGDSSVLSLARKLQLATGLGKVAAIRHNVKKLYGRKAELVGSRGLGTDLKENADTDVLITYKQEKAMHKAIARLAKKHGLKPSKYNSPNKSRVVYQNKDTDVVFSTDDRVKEHLKSFLAARDKLTNKQKHQIRREKRKILNSRVFKDRRYKNYKKDLDKKLGIIRL